MQSTSSKNTDSVLGAILTYLGSLVTGVSIGMTVSLMFLPEHCAKLVSGTYFLTFGACMVGGSVMFAAGYFISGLSKLKSEQRDLGEIKNERVD
jgi:hypothetical protein